MPKAALAAAFCALLFVATRAQAGTFPDAHELPPAGWTGPEFKLRQDYPTSVPAVGAKPWKSFSFRTQPQQYMNSVLAYCLEGNTAVDWQLDQNTVRKWYHAPWMHSTDNGREFVHGLTRERGSRPKELAPTQTGSFQNWAVGMYNAPGGYVVGQVWKDPNAPNATKAKFPDGTVACKLLFTTASVAQVPYLQGSFDWQANIYATPSATTRSINTVHLLQMDIAVRDSRAATTTGWVYGTFVFDGNATGATPWDKLEPVGLMWGNDPTVKDPAHFPTTHLVQGWINTSVGPKQHLGRAGRVNGPVDNPISSCLSCHSTSQYKALTGPVPNGQISLADTMRWFRNVKATTPFDAGQVSLGYSLQLATGIQRFLQAHPTAHVTASSAAATTHRAAKTIKRGEP
jgi:hypothetical protein